MRLKAAKEEAIASIISHVSGLKAKGFYSAARESIENALVEFPKNELLQALQRRIELLEKIRAENGEQ